MTTIVSGPTTISATAAGIAADAGGNLYLADPVNGVINKISPTGVFQAFAGQSGTHGYSDGTGAGAQFMGPTGVAVDSNGNVYVADRGANTIRKITPSGAVTTIAGAPGSFGYQDGPGSQARFEEPAAIATDAAGNLFVADSARESVRKIDLAGTVSTIAGIPETFGLQGIAVDGQGNVFVSGGPPDFYAAMLGVPYPDTIYKVSPSGSVTTYAGQLLVNGSSDGTGTEALFYNPVGLATDAAGNLFVADSLNGTIREISPDGVVMTVAGTVGSRALVDGVGSQARFNGPIGVATDTSGNVFVLDETAVRRGIPSVNTQGPIRFVNISARSMVTPSSPLIAGFVIEGNAAQTVLARAVGSGLTQFGVSNPIQDVQLTIYSQGGTPVASSADGASLTNSGSASAMVGAFPLAADAGDAGLVVTLKPGPYTALVSSKNGATGTALLEVYEVP